MIKAQETNMIKALLSMGYRISLKKNVYSKPVAFNLFTFELDTLLWTNWFMGANDKIYIWESHVYEEDKTVQDDFLRHLKYTEAYTRLSDRESNMEFITPQQIAELIL